MRPDRKKRLQRLYWKLGPWAGEGRHGYIGYCVDQLRDAIKDEMKGESAYVRFSKSMQPPAVMSETIGKVMEKHRATIKELYEKDCAHLKKLLEGSW